MQSKFLSRKFLIAVFGGIAVAMADQFNIDAEVTKYIVGIVSAYIFGQSYVDAKFSSVSESSQSNTTTNLLSGS